MLLRILTILVAFHVADLAQPEPTGGEQPPIPVDPDLSEPNDSNKEHLRLEKGECMYR
jgi:hypothetical protein